MFECLGCFIYGILTVTATHEGVAHPIRRINSLALQVALDDKNHNTDLSDSVNTGIYNNNKLSHDYKDGNRKKFTDFIQAVIEILNKYDDSDIEHFFTILNYEVGKYHYHGCKFSELTGNNDLIKFISSKFKEMSNMPAADIRQIMLKIANQIQDSKYQEPERDLIDFINLLYKQDSVEKFKKLLNKINDYRLKTEADLRLEKIIREGLRTLIFNHYTKLNYNTRAALKSKLDKYWEHMKPLSLSLRSQLQPIEMKLLHNKNENVETFYYTTKLMHNSEKKYQTENWKTGANMKAVSFMNLYPKLPIDLQIMSYQTEKRSIPKLLTLKHDSISYEKGNDVSLESNKKLYDQSLIEQATSGENRYTTEIIPNQYEENFNDDDNYIAASEVGNKVADITTANYDSLYVEDMPAFTTELFRPIGRQESYRTPKPKRPSHVKNKRSEATGASYAPFYLITDKSHVTKKRHIKMPGEIKQVPQKIIRTVLTTHKAYIEVVTMRPFLPTRMVNPKKIKYDINLKSAGIQPIAEVQEPAKTDYIKSSNEDAANVDKDLSIEEIKDEHSTRVHRRSYNNYLSADTVLIDKDVLTRIKELENELNNVRTLANNDTEMIEDLKSNLEFVEMEAAKTSKEITNTSPENIVKTHTFREDMKMLRNNYDKYKKDKLKDYSRKQHNSGSAEQRKHILYRNYLNKPKRRRLSVEDIRIEHDLEDKTAENNLRSYSEREEITNLDKFDDNERVRNIHYNDETNEKDQMLYARRAVMNKAEEMKNKFDSAENNNDMSRGIDSLSAERHIAFQKEFIPDTDVFNRNVKNFENYLDKENNTKHALSEEQDNIYSRTMLSKEENESKYAPVSKENLDNVSLIKNVS